MAGSRRGRERPRWTRRPGMSRSSGHRRSGRHHERRTLDCSGQGWRGSRASRGPSRDGRWGPGAAMPRYAASADAECTRAASSRIAGTRSLDDDRPAARVRSTSRPRSLHVPTGTTASVLPPAPGAAGPPRRSPASPAGQGPERDPQEARGRRGGPPSRVRELEEPRGGAGVERGRQRDCRSMAARWRVDARRTATSRDRALAVPSDRAAAVRTPRSSCLSATSSSVAPARFGADGDVQRHDGIQEVGLVRDADGPGAVQAGDALQPGAGQRASAATARQGSARVPDVAPEPDVRPPRHVVLVRRRLQWPVQRAAVRILHPAPAEVASDAHPLLARGAIERCGPT